MEFISVLPHEKHLVDCTDRNLTMREGTMATRKLLKRLVCLAVLGIFAGADAQGANLTVCASGCRYQTIQSAVNGAADGDNLVIGVGVFAENVLIAGKQLSVFGSGPALTVVQGKQHGGPVFVLGSAAGQTYYEVDISDLTVAQGDHQGGSGVGGGIQVRQGAFLHLNNVTASQNYAAYGAGIGVNTPGGPPSTLSNCSVDQNEASSEGGGVFIASGSTVEILGCAITRNVSVNGGGIFADTGSTLTVSGTNVSDNQAAANGCGANHCPPSYGGGLYTKSGLTLVDSFIIRNSAGGNEGAGAGLYIQLGSSPTVRGTIIARNLLAGSVHGAGIFAASQAPSATLTLEDDYIVLNENNVSGGATPVGGIQNQGTLVITNTTFKDNTGLNCSGGVGCPAH
jgi:hypothetical protein